MLSFKAILSWFRLSSFLAFFHSDNLDKNFKPMPVYYKSRCLSWFKLSGSCLILSSSEQPDRRSVYKLDRVRFRNSVLRESAEKLVFFRLRSWSLKNLLLLEKKQLKPFADNWSQHERSSILSFSKRKPLLSESSWRKKSEMLVPARIRTSSWEILEKRKFNEKSVICEDYLKLINLGCTAWKSSIKFKRFESLMFQ
jgi:hypothetical protein